MSREGGPRWLGGSVAERHSNVFLSTMVAIMGDEL